VRWAVTHFKHPFIRVARREDEPIRYVPQLGSRRAVPELDEPVGEREVDVLGTALACPWAVNGSEGVAAKGTRGDSSWGGQA